MDANALSALRLVWITGGKADADGIVDVGGALLEAGVRAIQLREPGLGARALAALCEALRPAVDAVDGLLLVNDRVDVAALGVCHGVHLGHRSLRPGQARRLLGSRATIGFSAHDPAELDAARREGADYASLSPVFATRSKPGQEPLGIERARIWTLAAGLPVVWLGGLEPSTIARCERSGAVGFACIRGLSDPRAPAPGDPVQAARACLEAVDRVLPTTVVRDEVVRDEVVR